LTAQAFLFTVALGDGTSPWARRIAAFLALLSALVSMQTMAKHRFFEEGDSKGCEKLEKELKLNMVLGYAPHALPSARQIDDGQSLNIWTRLKSFLVTRRSFVLWQGLFWLFAASAAVVIALSFTGVLS
jgi:hypothetical protein